MLDVSLGPSLLASCAPDSSAFVVSPPAPSRARIQSSLALTLHLFERCISCTFSSRNVTRRVGTAHISRRTRKERKHERAASDA